MKVRSSRLARALLVLATMSASTTVGAEAPVASAKGQVFELPAAAGEGGAKEVKVLLDESHLKLVTIALRAGTVLPTHAADAPTTIHVLAGEGVIHVGGEAVPVKSGTILALAAGAEHDVVPKPGSDMLLLVHYLRGAAGEAAASPTHDHAH